MIMSTNAVVRARIDYQTKQEAMAVLADLGITLSAALRMMLIRVAKEKTLPFEPWSPNAETIAAMQQARQEKLPRFDNIDALMADLNAED
jgi:DNA-damage-inducible protein J